MQLSGVSMSLSVHITDKMQGILEADMRRLCNMN